MIRSRVRIDTAQGNSYHVTKAIAEKKVAEGSIKLTGAGTAIETRGAYKIRCEHREWIPTQSGIAGPTVLQLV